MKPQPSERLQRRRDTLAGAGPALYLALGIGIITGGSAALAMIITALMLTAIGGLGSGTSELFALLGVSLAFWLGTSVGIILGVSAGFRAWVALYPAYERRTAAAEQQAAVNEVEDLLRRSTKD